MNKLDQSIEYFNKALTHAPNNPKILQELGVVYLRQNNYDRAVATLKKALDINPKLYGAKIPYGAAVALSGNHEKSDIILKELFAVDSSMGFQMLNIINSINASKK